MISDQDQRAPFLVPFIVALLFGIPASLLFHFVSTQYGLLISAITILIGLSCGFGARVGGRGSHPAGAAIIATAVLIVINIATTTVLVLAAETGQSFLATLFSQSSFTDFANECVEVAGRNGRRAFIGYAIAFYSAYKFSDGT